MMAHKTILYLCAKHLRTSRWKNGILSDTRYFTDDAEDKARFAAYLKTHRDPLYLLTDLGEEDFHTETVPHTRGSDRAALMQRKQEQLYRHTPFRRAAHIRRLEDGRRDDMMLFSALTDPDLVSPWLDILQEHELPLAGIYSIATISGTLIKSTERLLLLSWEECAGLRLSYFDSGHLHFSRLTPMSDGVSFCVFATSEAARTKLYLQSRGLLPQGQGLRICVICHAKDKAALVTHLYDNAILNCTVLDIEELARRVNFKMNCNSSDTTPLFLHLLARKPPRHHYATAMHTRIFRLRQMRKVLAASGTAILMAGLLWGTLALRTGMALNDGNRAILDHAFNLAQQAQQTTSGLPGTLVPAADIKSAVLLMRKLDNSPPPQAMLGDLSLILNEYPRIRLNRLAWQSGILGNPPAIIHLDSELDTAPGDSFESTDYLERFRLALIQHGYEVQASPMLPTHDKQNSSNDDATGNAMSISLQLKCAPT